MARRVEDLLRRGMRGVGTLVEKAIGTAQQARATVAAGSAAPAPPALETLLGLPKLRELLQLAADRLVPPLLPNLAGRAVLEVGEGTGRFTLACKEHGAQIVAAFELGAAFTSPLVDMTRRMYVVRGSVRRLPFRDDRFDFGIANLATSQQGDLLRALKEVSRVIQPEGTVVLIDFHPFGWYARRGATRIKPVESTLRGTGDYFKAARLAGLQLCDLREAFIDETMRAAFATPEEKVAYRTVKESPLLLCCVLRKGAAGER
ncbi:MAG: class I SAM-dependent methyltransferase [Deltaproteobacteria bacterium]|nr:class I SAM-dependent methyltransferase [Deltaproteobacteria bacterium]